MSGLGTQPLGTSPLGTGGDGTGSPSPLVATVQPDATPPRVRLDLTTKALSVTIYRVGPDGTRTPVRTYDGGPLSISGGATFLYDPEVPYGRPVYYTTDAGDTSLPVVVDVPDVWLIHPAVPNQSLKVRVADISEKDAPANVSVRRPLGRKYPIVASDGRRQADTYTLTLRTETGVEVAALKRLLDDLSPLLLNIPASLGWVDAETEYVVVTDLSRANPIGFAGSGYREWTLLCTVVDRPVGGSQAFNTYGYSYSQFGTYGERRAAAATYGDAFDTV